MFWHLFAELFREVFSSLIKTNTAASFNNLHAIYMYITLNQLKLKYLLI